jgi:hypothetical protein
MNDSDWDNNLKERNRTCAIPKEAVEGDDLAPVLVIVVVAYYQHYSRVRYHREES